MKKTDRHLFILIAALFSLASACTAYPSEPRLQSHITADSIKIYYSVPAESLEVLFDSLARGQTAEIRYEFRLFRETRGILSLLGDRMLLEEMVVYRAWYNEFDPGYILETSAGEVSCSSFGELQSRMARAEVVFQTAPSADEGRLYIRVRATVIPRKLSPPFTLLEPFYPRNHMTDGWKERTIIGRQGDS